MNPVAYGITVPAYNEQPPFHPDASFPELPFREVSPAPNPPYQLLRDLFRSLDLDREHFGTPVWNPLGGVISPGQTVLLKPNFVCSYNAGGDDLFAMVTHPSILRALVDYAYIALKGEGRILIADVPQMDCDWEELMRAERLESVQEFYQARFRFPIEIHDFRNFALIDRRRPPLTANRRSLPGDPAGEVIIDLGRRSHFYGQPGGNYYGADFNRQETLAHHQGERQEYCLSKTMLSAHTILSVPKMKTHKKVGVTLNLKGLVGLNTNKNFLVHYRLGAPSRGGDQFPEGRSETDRALVKLQRWAYDRLLARQSRAADAVYSAARAAYRAAVKPFLSVSEETTVLDAGNWYGNDSAWRMTADLAKILFFADASGQFHDTPQRKMFCVVDGIIGGELEGPLEPAARRAGCLVAGAHPFAVDLVTARLMGFDPRKLRQFDVAFAREWNFGLAGFSDLEIRAPGKVAGGDEFFSAANREPHFGFRPPSGWMGRMEIMGC